VSRCEVNAAATNHGVTLFLDNVDMMPKFAPRVVMKESVQARPYTTFRSISTQAVCP